jgi:hypothetical protein
MLENYGNPTGDTNINLPIKNPSLKNKDGFENWGSVSRPG